MQTIISISSFVDRVYSLYFCLAVTACRSDPIHLFDVRELLLFRKSQNLTIVDLIINVGVIITYKYTKFHPIYLKIVSVTAKKLQMGPTLPILITSNRRKRTSHKHHSKSCPGRRMWVKDMYKFKIRYYLRYI